LKKTEKEKKKQLGVIRSIVFISTEENGKFAALRFAIQCKLVLLIKECRKKCRALGSEEGKVMRRGLLEYA
jgi:hypothetical protein